MIAKKAPRRKDSKSSFSALAKYIMRDGKDEAENIEYTRVTNCNFDDFDMAVREIEATQGRNKRSKSDKTFHMVISFPAGERPTDEQLEDIENEMCKSVGLGDHQRISALHTDTDNIHLHVAVNKINPVSYRNVELLRDHYRMDEACSLLEERHGLQRDNRIDRGNTKDREIDLQPGRAGDMEAHSGLDSFKRWLGDRKDSIAKEVGAAKSWDEVHQALAKHDLEIRPRGSGLVVSARGEKAFTKASDLGRDFGKKGLEARLGEYRPPSDRAKSVDPEERYRKPPKHDGAEKTDLWDIYQREKHQAIADKRALLDELRRNRRAEIERQKADYAARKKAIQKDRLLTNKQKREAYKKLSLNRKLQSEASYKKHQEAMSHVYETYQVKGWQDYLIDKASEGNKDALKVLRSSVRRAKKGAERFAFLGSDEGQIFTPLKPDVQANGDVLYSVSGVRIRDTGERLQLDTEKGEGIADALRLAREKYGDHLKVDGTDEFKAAVVEAAVSSGQAVTFADPAMERRRQVLQDLADTNKDHQEEVRRRESELGQVQKWIENRNETGRRTNDIMQHRLFKESDSGAAIYKGSRNIEGGQKVALFEKSGEMLVVPVTERQAARFKRERVGSSVTLNKRGHVQFQQDRGHGR